MLLIQLSQFAGIVHVTYRGPHFQEAVLLDRYLETQGIVHGFTSSASADIGFECDKIVARKVHDQFEKEFGLVTTQTWPSVLLPEERKEYVVSGATGVGQDSWSGIVDDSLLRHSFTY